MASETVAGAVCIHGTGIFDPCEACEALAANRTPIDLQSVSEQLRSLRDQAREIADELEPS